MSASALPGTTVPQGSSLSTTGSQGLRGPRGERGQRGERGPKGPSTITTTQTPFSVPQAGQSAQTQVQDASWVRTGQMLYVEGAGTDETGLFQAVQAGANSLSLKNPIPSKVSPAAKPFRYIAGDTLLSPEYSGYYLICLGGEMTLYLPQPELALSYSIRNDMTSAPSGPVHLVAHSGSLIDKQEVLNLWPEGQRQLFTDGANWRTFGGGGGVPVGTLLAFAGKNPPIGFLFCDGEWYELENYPRLFAAIGHDHTTNDGTHSLAGWFQVPDLRSRVPVGTGPLDTQPSHNFTLAQKYGTPSHALTSAELAGHAHSLDINHTHAVGINAHAHGFHDPTHQQWMGRGGSARPTPFWGGGGHYICLDAPGWWSGHNSGTGCWVDQAGNPGGWTNWVSEQAANWHVRGTSNSGSGLAHNNVPPSLGVNYIIKF